MTALRRLVRLNRVEIALLAAALVVLARVRVALWLLPWQRMMRTSPAPRPQPRPRCSVGRLEWAIRSASRAVPHATCLTQALALDHLLRREGYAGTVQIGVKNDDGSFAAHAWVECHGAPLLSSVSEVSRYSRFFTWPRPHTEPVP